MKEIKVIRNKEKVSKADENVLAMYLKEINRIPLLTRDEEEKVAREAIKGNTVARNKLINGNLRFVVNIAKKYQGKGIPLADLINEGNIGLIKAVEKYDVNRGYHFISYAVWWIRQSIIKALCDQSRFIRLPVNRAAELMNIEKAQKLLSGSGNDDDEIREIASMLNMDENNVEDILAISKDIVSLDTMVNTGNGVSPLCNMIIDTRYSAPDQDVIHNSLKTEIEKVLDTLDSKEAEIIRCRYGLGKNEPMSLIEIGERFNLTKERIRQIEQKALVRLQYPSRKSKLEAYVA